MAADVRLDLSARLLDSTGGPASGSTTVDVSLHDTESSGVMWSDSFTVTPESGYANFTLGRTGNAITTAMLADGATWYEIRVDGVLMGSREQLHSVPYAAMAQQAESLAGGTVDAVTLPYEIHFSGSRWLNSDLIQFVNANAVFASGNMQVGTNFGGDPTTDLYATVPVLPAGAVPAGARVRVHLDWLRSCRTTDCDRFSRLVAGDGTFVQINTNDNNTGEITFTNGTEAAADTGVGNITYMSATIDMGGTGSNVAWRAFDGGIQTGVWSPAEVMDPSTGLTLELRRGDNTEGYIEQHLTIRVELL